MSKNIYFYDTSSLLELSNELKTKNHLYISSITLQELEEIKTSYKKTPEVRQQARQVISFLAKNPTKYTTIIYNEKTMPKYIKKFPGYIDINDGKILACACFLKNTIGEDDLILVTHDLAMLNIAKELNLWIEPPFLNEEEKEDYTGYKIVNFTDEELANFYANVVNTADNPLGLLTNEYLLIKNSKENNKTNPIIDKYVYTGTGYRKINYLTFESMHFGITKPMDDIQSIAMDGLNSSQIVLLRGPAGSGKSFLAMSYLFYLLEKKKIDKIIIFCNTVATANSAKLGYYPGSREEKLLDSSIGNFLSSKLGDKTEVERLIAKGELLLLPMSDIRGYDTSGMNAGIYITEAQNLDISLMKLALQRIGDDSICILDGDDNAQVDMDIYAGSNNGLKRVSEVFANADFYTEVTLLEIHRSKIAKLAQKM